MTPADLIAGIRELEAENARLRAQVAALTAAPATTTTTTDGALLPCPFCGRTDTLEMAGARSHYVLCNCGGTCVAGPSGGTESEAITRWNTRALLTASTPSPAPADNSGAESARGEGAFAGQRACWDCRHWRGMQCDHLGTLFGQSYAAHYRWMQDNRHWTGEPLPGARNCPGWAPREAGGCPMDDTKHAIPSAEATAYPVWIIVSGKLHDRYHAGVWFSRKAAEEHLVAKRHRYPRGAVVYCHTGHMSADYRHLCETGTLPPKSGEVSDG